ncbi:YdcF family protein [Candidatus Saccharibacteria bacterium]|nr:YdcF family protein [Candidatus Saccharibacteria bacterium]
MAIEAQVALVHGGGIEPVPFTNGEFRLQPGSEARAIRGIELFQAGVVEALLFSGGNAHGHDLPDTEARLMADLAVEAGISAKKIEIEPQSSSTIGNWANSLTMMLGNGTESILGVTGRVARPRAQAVGTALIHHYDLGVELVGYRTTKEPIGISLAREALSIGANGAWLLNAARKGRSLQELDEAYRDRRQTSKVAKVKEVFTHR